MDSSMAENNESDKKPLYIFLHLPKNGGASLNRNVRKKLPKESFLEKEEKIQDLTKKRKDELRYIYGHDLYYGIHKYFPHREPRYIVFIRDPAERRTSQYNHDIARLQEKRKHKKLPSFKKWYRLQIKDEQTFLLNKKFRGIPGRKAPHFTNKIQKMLKIGKSKSLKIMGYKTLRIYDTLRKNRRHKERELENAKSLLNNCWFVSITKNLDEDIPKIFQEMGLDTKWERYRSAKNKGEKTSKEKYEVTKKFELDNKTRQIIYKDNPYDLKLYEYAKSLNKRI